MQYKPRQGGTVRVGTVMAIPATLEELGVDLCEVMAAAQLDPMLFDDPDNLISYS